LKRNIIETGVAWLLVAWLAILGGSQTPAWSQVTKAQAAKKPAARAKDAPKDVTGADALTLRDGKTLLGQILDPSPRGTYIVLVRRAWAEANLPGWVDKWKATDKEASDAAERQRHDRLIVWNRDRLASPAGGERISAWLDKMLARAQGQSDPSVLMTVRLKTSDVKTVQRRGMAAARALRLGWLFGFKNVETMTLDDLKDAIAGRGMTVNGEEPIALDPLLPAPVENETQWLILRAATEVQNDEGLRFIRFGNTLMPEPAPGQPPDPNAAAAVLSDTLKDILGSSPSDPLAARLRDVAARGRVGALVTRLDLAPDFSSVTVESALFVRGPNGVWTRGPWRSGTLRSGDVAPGAAQALADDPQVKAAFQIVDSIWFGGVSEEMKRRSLAIGATTKRALGMVRAALSRDLESLALSLQDPVAAAKKPEPKP
jgi:hypothetical protein